MECDRSELIIYKKKIKKIYIYSVNSDLFNLYIALNNAEYGKIKCIIYNYKI